MKSYTLFGTEGCHLCDEAGNLLQAAHVDYEKIDIVNDDDAWQRYSVRIPVLRHIDGEELDWPFDTQALLQFLTPTALEENV
jgi:glutaredoxin